MGFQATPLDKLSNIFLVGSGFTPSELRLRAARKTIHPSVILMVLPTRTTSSSTLDFPFMLISFLLPLLPEDIISLTNSLDSMTDLPVTSKRTPSQPPPTLVLPQSSPPRLTEPPASRPSNKFSILRTLTMMARSPDAKMPLSNVPSVLPQSTP